MERVSVSWIFRACLLFMLIAAVWEGAQAEQGSETYVPGEVIVKYADIGSGTAVASVASSLNAEIGAETIYTDEVMGVKGMQVVKVPDTMSVPDAVQFYKSNEHVVYAEPNYVTHLPAPLGNSENVVQTLESEAPGMTIPNDPDFNLQWGMYNTQNGSSARADISAPEAWNISTGSSEVIVAVIDSGVDYNHEDLAENCISGYDFVNNDDDPMDDNGHGTHCAGTISAVTNNSKGIAGVSWNSKILPVKVFDAAGQSNTVLEILGILYAKEQGADIISCSWGSYIYSEALKEAIESTPALFVCAAGNEGYDTDEIPFYPADYNSANIISVGASDRYDMLTWFSNYGLTSVDLLAPGEDIYSTLPGTYGMMDGTSMAAPFVAGTAALIKSEKPGNDAVQIKNLILNSVDQKFWLNTTCVTGGRLNAYRPLSQVLPLHAEFKAEPSSGTIPLTVQFTDMSSGEPESWHWTFGDGFESTLQNPTHLYMKPGKYTITLTVYKEGLSSIAEKENYIHVKPPYQPVKAFPDGKGGFYPVPTDPDDDGLFDDINGNGWLEYEDPKLLFDQMLYAIKEEPIGQFDFDKSGFIGFGDVVKLYQMV
ncbi:MAG TPA: S8 family serine peptidase [Methanospirillum sp.]|uniref:S8 family serine peptidase n=1 Tax=Methanospirillum sp. TaxID=45200 RepID=UPI002B6AEDCE|nr:S8 family serine peptidase [Methanospirillum sp.]HOJ96760.1 S8 family serine peptidase [Methanospirillum sp.]HOL41658.1 S8 family serine peptidase [Methanospirillum sp.]